MYFAVYIATNPNRDVLYTGTTNNLPRRLVEHYLLRGSNSSFAGKNYCYCLVFYDVFPTMNDAIAAEKRIKGKSRKWKEELIKSFNSEWKFLNHDIVGEWPPNSFIKDPYFKTFVKKL